MCVQEVLPFKMKKEPSTTAADFFQTMQVRSYQDIDRVESEIKRLLRCSTRRMPVCMTTEPYIRFRCALIQRLLHHLDNNNNIKAEELSESWVHLSQGLVAKASSSVTTSTADDNDDAVATKIQLQVSLGWEHCCSHKEEEEGGSDEDNKNNNKSAGGKRRKRCLVDE